MKLLLSSMLLASLCAPSSWSASSDEFVVTQTPDVSVMEGETLNINCCLTGGFGGATVNWLKNQTFIKSERLSLINKTSNCSTWTFTNITREDSGRYTCEVTIEIPIFSKVNGSGTVITVTARESTTDNTGADTPLGSESSSPVRLPVIIGLAVVVPLLLIALACACKMRRKQARAARVIYEVPHIDSEEADMDKHSTSSSRGSSQWCQVPVYESFDYFERVVTKESG